MAWAIFRANAKAVGGALDRAGIDHGPRKLLDEERHAIGSFHDLAGNPARHDIAACDGCDHLLAFVRRQLLQGNPSNGRARQPVRAVVIAMRDQDHDPLARTASYYAYQQFDGGRVHPLDVLDDHQDGPLARGRDKNIDEHLKSTLALRREIRDPRVRIPSRRVSTGPLRSIEVRARHWGRLLPEASAILPMQVPRRRLPGCRSRA